MTTEPGHAHPPIGYPAGQEDGSSTRGGDHGVYIDTSGQTEPGRMIVDPDKLVLLKQGIQDERDRIANWLFQNRSRLRTIESPGEDPCSKAAMAVLGQNGQMALGQGDAYVDRLTEVVRKMAESATAYDQVEDATAAAFRRGPA
jgi:hypothetical protein